MQTTDSTDRYMQLERSMRRRFRLVTGALLALILVVNVAPVAADHLIVRSSDIVDGAVNTRDLRNRSVGTAKLKNESIGTYKLKNGAVGTKKLKNGAVNTPDMRNGAIGTHKLKNGAVGTAKLRDGGIEPRDIANGAVTNSKIRNGSIGPGKLSSNAIPARGYARVSHTGRVVDGTGQNISSANITRPNNGQYCFHELPFQPTVVVATPLLSTPPMNPTYLASSLGGCPPDTQFVILIQRSDTGGPFNVGFNVMVM